MEMRDENGAVCARVDGIHFTIGHYIEGDRPEDSFFNFRGQRVSILASTLEHLDGKHLVLTGPDWTKRKQPAKRSILRTDDRIRR
jgi:hypothetical protein